MLARRQIAHLRLYDLSGVADEFKVNMKRRCVFGFAIATPVLKPFIVSTKTACLPNGIAHWNARFGDDRPA